MGGAGPSSQPAGDDGALEELADLLAPLLTPTTAIVCVGNDLCGDDGVGPAVARDLAGTVPWAVFDARTAPESFLGKIIAGRPESVVLIDALDFGGPVGAVRIIPPGDVGGQGPSTHGPAPLAFLEALAIMCPCRCAVVGVQPGHVEPGTPMSPPVARAGRRLVHALRRLARTDGNAAGM